MAIEERANHLVIGRKDYSGLEYLDAANGGFRTIRDSTAQQAAGTSMDLIGNMFNSGDGKWVARWSSDGQYEISKIDDPGKKFVVSRKNMLTPLFWTTDERFVFFVRKIIWGNPLTCSFEDERDIIVYDLVAGGQDVVATLCGGHPYGDLRWFKLP